MVLNEHDKAQIVFERLKWKPKDRTCRKPKDHMKTLLCERCGEPISVKIKQTRWGDQQRYHVWLDGIFHHRNGDRVDDSAANITLVCYHCHVHYHTGLRQD